MNGRENGTHEEYGNVVDLKEYRSRKERRKAQKSSLFGGVFRIEKPNTEPESPARTPVSGRGSLRRSEKREAQHTPKGPMPKTTRIAVIVLAALLAAALAVLLGLKVFTVHRVEVFGGVNFTRADIIKAAGIKDGQSIFTVNAGRITENLRSTPQLQLVTVSKRLPGTVMVKVKETTPTVVVGYLGQYVTLDEELRVVSTESMLPTGQYPLVTGMVVRGADTASKVVSDDPLQTQALEAIITAFSRRSDTAEDSTYAPLHYVTEISLNDVDHLVLMTDSGYRIELGNEESMDRKAMWAEQMLPLFIAKGYTGGTLDVAGPKSATFIPADGQGTTVTTTPAAVPEGTPEETTAPAEEETTAPVPEETSAAAPETTPEPVD